jgi:hypothetical protein
VPPDIREKAGGLRFAAAGRRLGGGLTMNDSNRQPNPEPSRKAADFGCPFASSQCIDWYSEGETRIVDANGVLVMVRFVGRHGRRGRIAITGPPGSTFRSADG